MFRKVLLIVAWLLFAVPAAAQNIGSPGEVVIGGGGGGITGFGGAVTAFGSVSSGTKTCPNSAATCTITLTSSSVTLDAAAPVNASALLIWRVTQDATGGRIPTWSSAFFFPIPSSGGSVGNPVVPIYGVNATEDFLYVWNSTTSKWDYLARGGVQQRPLSSQGGATAIGGPSNANNTVTTLPANTWTQVTADNGGFFTAQNGGVATYTYNAIGTITICNHNASTEYFSVTLLNTGFYQRVTVDRPVDASECVNVPFFTNLLLNANTQFGTFSLLINPTNSLALLSHTYFSLEIPGN